MLKLEDVTFLELEKSFAKLLAVPALVVCIKDCSLLSEAAAVELLEELALAVARLIELR